MATTISLPITRSHQPRELIPYRTLISTNRRRNSALRSPSGPAPSPLLCLGRVAGNSIHPFVAFSVQKHLHFMGIAGKCTHRGTSAGHSSLLQNLGYQPLCSLSSNFPAEDYHCRSLPPLTVCAALGTFLHPESHRVAVVPSGQLARGISYWPFLPAKTRLRGKIWGYSELLLMDSACQLGPTPPLKLEADRLQFNVGNP